jgi:fructose-bisphosphate aldolase class II
MLTTTASLMRAATANRTPILAFNVITLEHVEAVCRAAERTKRPVILQISENAVKYHGGAAALAATCRILADETAAELALHLDHVESLDLAYSAPALGVSSLMFDASKLPDAENTDTTRAVTDWAHGHGLFVEAELGAIGGKGNAHTPGVRTDPDDAARFVAATGVDALAVAVGSSHAMTQRSARLDQELIATLAVALPVPLVLHGSSGIADADLRVAATNGIVKINIGTLLNVAFTQAVRTMLAADGDQVDPRKYLGAARDATTDVVAGLLHALGGPQDQTAGDVN